MTSVAADDVVPPAASETGLDDLARSADSILRSILADPTLDDAAAVVAVDAASDNKAKPNANPKQTQAPGQQLLSATDVPAIANAITTLVNAPAPDISRSNAVQENPVASPGPAAGPVMPLAKESLVGKVAFTAILTPSQITGASAAAYASKQVSPLPEPAIPVTSTAPPSGVSQLPANGLESQPEIQGAGPRTGGETAPQQQDDAPESQASAAVLPADAKNKAAVAEDDADPQAIATSAAGAVPDHAGGFTSFTEQGRTMGATPSDTSASMTTSTQTTSSRATADALRTSESDLAAAPQARTGAAQEITIRIEQPDASPVDLRVVERSGQLHVDVRTPDAAMQTSLREDLGTLTNSLQGTGYHAEIFTPSSGVGRTASSAQTGNQNEHRDFPQNRGGSGGSSEGRRQQQPQKRPSTWLEEMEDQ
jgi:hypothetical protein